MSLRIIANYLLNFVNKFFGFIGYNIVFVFKDNKNKDYEMVLPTATYSPWNKDQRFNILFNRIKNYTIVDKYRCYELWQLVEQSKKVPGALIEIGVWRGGTGAVIGKKAELCGINDTLYLCDTFKGIVKADPSKDTWFQGSEYRDASVKTVNKLVFQKVKLKNVKILEGIFPDETKHLVKEDKFRFCHIDVDVYQSAFDIITWIWNKMSKGGIIVYDDYGSYECGGIREFVDEERKKADRLVIHNLNGHAIIIKLF